MIERTICFTCGIVFGVPDHYLQARRQQGNIFYCPNGHPLSYIPPKPRVSDTELKLLHANEQMGAELEELKAHKTSAPSNGVVVRGLQ